MSWSRVDLARWSRRGHPRAHQASVPHGHRAPGPPQWPASSHGTDSEPLSYDEPLLPYVMPYCLLLITSTHDGHVCLQHTSHVSAAYQPCVCSIPAMCLEHARPPRHLALCTPCLSLHAAGSCPGLASKRLWKPAPPSCSPLWRDLHCPPPRIPSVARRTQSCSVAR